SPLLAHPQLSKVAQAIEEDNHSAAARLLEGVLVDAPPPATDAPRWQFLLGTLRERAEELEGAAASYDLATERAWPLYDYALLGAARVELRRGRADRALKRLAMINREGAIAAPTRLLQAEALLLEGDQDRAIEAWKA